MAAAAIAIPQKYRQMSKDDLQVEVVKTKAQNKSRIQNILEDQRAQKGGAVIAAGFTRAAIRTAVHYFPSLEEREDVMNVVAAGAGVTGAFMIDNPTLSALSLGAGLAGTVGVADILTKMLLENISSDD